MKKVSLILFLFLFCYSLSGCAGSNPAVNGVEIISNKTVYAPVTQWIYSFDKGIYSDGARKQPEEVAGDLKAVK